MSLDADTIGCLEDVKKGKPRRFVMICKGVQIKSLVVYKKGSLERYKKQAKEEGKGQFYHGIIDGKGVDIVFKLCRADGYEKPPGKELILKDFLTTEADLKFKPVYEIVDVLPELGEAEEDAGPEGESEQDATPPEAPPVPQTAAPMSDDLAAECKRLKSALYPQVKSAVAAHPGQKDAIIRLLGLADKHAKATEFASAIENYHELSAVLASLPTSEKAGPDPAVLFNERLKALLPNVKAAAGTPAGDEAKLKVSEAGVSARKKDFVQANALLDQAEQALKQTARAVPEAPPPPGNNAADLFKARLAELVPQIRQAAGTPAGDEAKLKTSEAGVFARKQDYDQANALLDEAEKLLSAPALAVPDFPTEKPSNRVQTALRTAAMGVTVSDDDDQLVDDLAALGPAFLAAAIDEPEMSTEPLALGAPISAQDQIFRIAAFIDSLGRKLDQWDAAIGEAEAAKSWLSTNGNEAEATNADYESYEECRARGQSLMEQVRGLVEVLRNECDAFKR